MLNDYRTKLEALRGKAGNDIDALIKVNKELAQVQNDIEALTGERAHLMQRVETEILNVSISSIEGGTFWRPIGNALSDFTRNLSNGISGVITALAYLLPWGFMVIVFWWGGRKLWFAGRKKVHSSDLRQFDTRNPAANFNRPARLLLEGWLPKLPPV